MDSVKETVQARLEALADAAEGLGVAKAEHEADPDEHNKLAVTLNAGAVNHCMQETEDAIMALLPQVGELDALCGDILRDVDECFDHALDRDDLVTEWNQALKAIAQRITSALVQPSGVVGANIDPDVFNPGIADTITDAVAELWARDFGLNDEDNEYDPRSPAWAQFCEAQVDRGYGTHGKYWELSAITSWTARALTDALPSPVSEGEIRATPDIPRDEPTVRVQIHGGVVAGVDESIAPLVKLLNDGGVKTAASCSGHGQRPGNIALADGRELIIARNWNEARLIDGLFPGINGEPARGVDAAKEFICQSNEEIRAKVIEELAQEMDADTEGTVNRSAVAKWLRSRASSLTNGEGDAVRVDYGRPGWCVFCGGFLSWACAARRIPDWTVYPLACGSCLSNYLQFKDKPQQETRPMSDVKRWPIVRHIRAARMLARLLHRQEVVWLGRRPPGWFGEVKRILLVAQGKEPTHD